MQTLQQSADGKNWEPAKQIPYHPNWLEKIKCALGFHELKESKKYEGTKACLLCGKRKIYKESAY